MKEDATRPPLPNEGPVQSKNPSWVTALRARRKGAPTRERSQKIIADFAGDENANPTDAQLRQIVRMICIELTGMKDSGTEDMVDALHCGLLGVAAARSREWVPTHKEATRLRYNIQRMIGIPREGGSLNSDEAEYRAGREAHKARMAAIRAA